MKKSIKFFTKAVILSFIFIFWRAPIAEAQTQVKQLWGMTSAGGQYGLGTIFKTDSIGNNQIVVHSFVLHNDGVAPQTDKLLQASDGKLYGTTALGGINNKGIIFQYDPTTSIYTKKFDFDGSMYGSDPNGTLIQASDGKLYGMTSSGGVNNLGVLFQFDPITSIYSKKLEFDGSPYGANPMGSLIQASNGKLYGMTTYGGANNLGVLFQYDLATSTYVKKIDFAGATNGANPFGALMQATDGSLYGIALHGGTNSLGVLFQYDPVTSTYTKKLDFAGATNGSFPYGPLMQANDGNLYGMTKRGGTNDLGTLYLYNPISSSFTKKFDFDGVINGAKPNGSIIQASDGNFYGMTSLGGINDFGVLFQYDLSTSTFTKKFDFGIGTTGQNPYASLLQANDGKLYGMTTYGGSDGVGVLFQYDPVSSIYTKKFDFSGTTNGANPSGSLLQANDGKLYGMSSSGGEYNQGILFQYDPAISTFTKKFDFKDTLYGQKPQGSLIQASDGKLYGMTELGGLNNYGVLFQFDPITSIYTKKLDFGVATGCGLYGSLMQANDGKLYGMAELCGTIYYRGVLFQYDPVTSIYTKKFDFDDTTSGQMPFGDLIQASDGKLYGMTSSGGAYNVGVLFQFDPVTSVFTKKLDFSGTTNGRGPNGSLIQASDGKLYGMTFGGGANDRGALFQYDPANSIFTKKFDFNSTSTGEFPRGSLKQASDGKLYGMTNQGGTNGKGVLFQYDPITSIYTKKLDFADTINGANPIFTSLIEINGAPVGLTSLEREVALKLYPNPAHDLLTLELLTGNQKNATLIIENLFGQVIYETQMNTAIHQIHTEHYTSGIYLVKVKTNDGVITKKVIVE